MIRFQQHPIRRTAREALSPAEYADPFSRPRRRSFRGAVRELWWCLRCLAVMVVVLLGVRALVAWVL